MEVKSIERRLTVKRKYQSTDHYLNLSITNLSKHKLAFGTNTCFYYNHCTLTIGDQKIELNEKGGCPFNSNNVYELQPGESFQEAIWITSKELVELPLGPLKISLQLPIILNRNNSYQIDGRGIYENAENLHFEGEIEVIKTVD